MLRQAPPLPVVRHEHSRAGESHGSLAIVDVTAPPAPTHMSEFFQDAPRLGNQWLDDRPLRELLTALWPHELYAELAPGLERLGDRAAGEMLALADAAESEPPRHVPFDPW